MLLVSLLNLLSKLIKTLSWLIIHGFYNVEFRFFRIYSEKMKIITYYTYWLKTIIKIRENQDQKHRNNMLFNMIV